MTAGGALALLAALAFGAVAPLVQWFGRGAGPFVTAALLYGGAAAFSGAWVVLGPGRQEDDGAHDEDARLQRTDLPRLLAVAFLGAVAAPVALAWGLQRTSGVAAALLLNLEAVFTVLLARVVWAEPIGRRVAVALLAMTAGGAILLARDASWTAAAAGPGGLLGILAIALATLGWAADNVVGKPLADRSAARVVFAKGSLGGSASLALSLVAREPMPAAGPAAALAACGAIGVGASLMLYLGAQRRIGAARTGSIFAAAPFVGAALACALGQRASGASTAAAGALFLAGLWLHLTEHHEHPHTHDAIAHSHAHSHDDPHHQHAHAAGAHAHDHSHEHLHERTTHAHPHGLDDHHRHRH